MKFKLIAGVMILGLLLSNLAFAKSADVAKSLQLEASDTVAGYSTLLKAMGAEPNHKAVFVLESPLGTQSKTEVTSDDYGNFMLNLDADYTKISGEYLYAMVYENQLSAVDSFEVFTGRVSPEVSVVEPANLYLSVGETEKMTVKLQDDFGNAVAGHLVRVVADGDNYTIKSLNELSDENGEAEFAVSMKKSGVASFSVYDATADKLLDAQSKVAASSSLAMGNASGNVDHFEFDEVPVSVKKGESISLKVKALDASDQEVVGYQGEIRFSVEGANSASVVLPDDYEFQISDQGEHVFSLAFLFQKTGNYKIKVTDTENLDVMGELDLEVVEENGDSGDSATITISNPISGTYSNNVQVISGEAPAGSRLKIFDNELELTSLRADASGDFSFTTGSLDDGEHKIYVASVNEVGTIIDTSAVIDLNIDTNAPEISNVVIEPGNTVSPGSPVKVKVYTDSELSRAALVFEGNLYELDKSDKGYFEGSIVAPNELGEYKLNFVLTDELGNESKFEGQASLQVSNLLGEGVAPNVDGLVATPEGGRVTLRWTAPTNAVTKIKNYRIYMGLSPNQLTEAIDTFTNATTWYVPNLQNGVKYYFAVIAVDEMGNTSQKFSNIVEGVPGGAVVNVLPVEVTNGTAGGEVFNEMDKDVSESGPGVWMLVIVSCLGGMFYCKMRPWTKRRSSIS